MTVRFQIMRDPRFHLLHQVTQRFSNGPEGEEYRLARAGFVLEETLKKKSEVYPGMLLATHPEPDMGTLYCPVRGVVSEINERYIIIAATAPKPDDPVVPTEDLSSLEGQALLDGLKKMGVDTRYLSQNKELLIVNGLNPEPGIT